MNNLPMLLGDHILAFSAAVLMPIYALATFPATRRKIAKQGEAARLHEYRETIFWQALFTAAALLLWGWHDRSWNDLGLGSIATGAAGITAIVLAAALLTFLLWQRNAVRSGQVDLSDAATQIESVDPIIPETAREKAWYRGVAIGAGISEELIWRGFLLWYFTPWIGNWGAAAMTAALFALGHVYQGWRRVPGVLVAACLVTGLRILTGSIWVPIVVHVTGDLLQGSTVSEVRRKLRALEA